MPPTLLHKAPSLDSLTQSKDTRKWNFPHFPSALKILQRRKSVAPDGDAVRSAKRSAGACTEGRVEGTSVITGPKCNKSPKCNNI